MANHFKILLNGSTTEQQKTVKIIQRTKENAEPISKEQFEQHVKQLKRGKAAGKDGIKVEAIIHADSNTLEKITVLISEYLNGAELPRNWREALIYPHYKKGDPEVAANYRGIAISNSGYKLYASILQSRLVKFAEENTGLGLTVSAYSITASKNP